MTSIAVDGLSEEAFRRLIESRLRHGKAAAAVDRLRTLLAPYAGPDCILPERFLTVQAGDFALIGWERLDSALRLHDQPHRPVTALSIAFGWPGENRPAPVPDAQGRLAPHVEISYFTDDAFPFSRSGRDDLLDGYSYHGCTWGDDCEATDTALSVAGIDDLHGALATLEARLLSSEDPDPEEIRAGSLGACLLSALLFQAVDERIARDGLPRPLCVMAGSNGVYPYFNAPVVGLPDEARKAAEAEDDLIRAGQAVPGPRYSSLVMTGIPRAKKRAVLVLDENESETATRVAKLRGLGNAGDEPELAPRGVLPAAPVPSQPDAAIGAADRSPLLAKKTTKPDWDFRDMLSPHEGRSPQPAEPLQPKLESPTEQPTPLTGGELPAGPGFSLLEPGLQVRLQALITPAVPQEAKSSEPARLSGQRWVEDDDEPPPSQPLPPDADTPQRRPGLWARLRDWVGRIY